MGQGSITRKASDLRPLLLDRFRNAAAAYSLRPLTLSGQDNPVVKVRRSVDNTEQDFNPAQINDGTLEQFVNAGDVAPADYGTGAAAAYSLRHVSDGYTGDVVRVRRSVDNTEQDFNPTEIEDGTLTSFVGGQNLLLRSEILGGGTGGASQTWTNFGTTYTANAINAPDGSLVNDAGVNWFAFQETLGKYNCMGIMDLEGPAYGAEGFTSSKLGLLNAGGIVGIVGILGTLWWANRNRGKIIEVIDDIV